MAGTGPRCSDTARWLAGALVRADAEGSTEAAVTDLLGELGRATGAEYVAFWSRTPDGSLEWAAWPAPRPVRLGADHVAAVPGGPAEPGGPGRVVLARPGGAPLDPDGRQLLAQVARCVGLLVTPVRLEDELRLRAERHRELVAALREAPARLRTARDLERRRGVTDVLSAITAPPAELRGSARDCATALTVDPAAARRAGQGFAGVLDDLIDRFRTVVRGVHSTVLQDHGLLAAVEEYAADLPRPLRLAGSPPVGPHPEVAAVQYHAVVSLLRALATAGAGPLTLSFAGGAPAIVRVSGHVAEPARLMAVLAPDRAQLAAVGGRLTPAVGPGGDLCVEVSVPDRLRPSTGPSGADPVAWAGPARAGPLERVRALCAAAVAADGDEAAGAALVAVLDRLNEPVRLAVCGPPDVAAAVSAVVRRRTGLTVRVMAAPDGSVDAAVHVLSGPGAVRLPPPGPGSPYPLAFITGTVDGDPRHRPGRHGVPAGIVALDARPERGVTDPDRPLLELVDLHVRGRSDVLRSRSALRDLRAVLRQQPVSAVPARALLSELAGIEAGAADLLELDALTALRTGSAPMPADELVEAERLLGAAGPSAQVRLGLTAGAGPTEVREAAVAHLARWARRAEHHVGSRAGHQVCRAAVRTCERMLTVGITPG